MKTQDAGELIFHIGVLNARERKTLFFGRAFYDKKQRHEANRITYS